MALVSKKHSLSGGKKRESSCYSVSRFKKFKIKTNAAELLKVAEKMNNRRQSKK